MKKLLVLFIFLCIAINIQAQHHSLKHQSRVALGFYFYGSGDILYPKIELEYRLGVAKIIDLGAVVNFGYTNNRFLNKFHASYNDLYVSNTITHLDLLLYLKAIDKHKFQLNIFFGPSYFYDYEYTKSMDEIYSMDDDILGLTAGFEANYKVYKNLAAGFRSGLSGVKDGAITWGASINLIKTWY